MGLQGVSNRVKSRNRNRERALLFRLTDDLVDPRPQVKISIIFNSSLDGRQVIAAVPRATSFMMALDEDRLRQLTRWRCRLDGFKS
jgi:hypothetical protein